MIIKDKKDEFISYLEDTSGLLGDACCLYLPETEQEVKEIFRECCSRNRPLTVASGRTGTTGGCIPQEGALLSSEKLQYLRIDSKNKLAIAQAGVLLQDLEKEANKFGLTLRAMPTEALATIGGVIATCASGIRGFKYGSIRSYIHELHVALTSEEAFNIKRGEVFAHKRNFNWRRFNFSLPDYVMPKVKNQAGYFVKDGMDLIDLFIGSEGTLGVITEAKIKLQDLPKRIFDLLIFFKEENSCFDFVRYVKKLKGAIFAPASLEFFDANSLSFLREEFSFVPAQAEAALYIEVEVEDSQSYENILNHWVSFLESYNTFEEKNILAESKQEREDIFAFRHRLPQMINEFLRQKNQGKLSTDIAVNDNAFLKMYNFYKEKGKEAGVRYVNFGHIGENHLHFNFLPANKAEYLKAKEYIRKFCELAVVLKGTISAEHGIGKIKKDLLKLMFSPEHLKQMARIKSIFDPCRILNLDNIFSRDLLLVI